MMKAPDAPRGDGNSLHSRTDNKVCLLYYTFTSIEYKGTVDRERFAGLNFHGF